MQQIQIGLNKEESKVAKNFLWGLLLFLTAIEFCNGLPKTYAYVVVPILGIPGVFLLLRACYFMRKS